MAETCIVCLGDLGENDHALPLPAGRAVKPDPDDDLSGLVPKASPPPSSFNEPDDGLIAHLLPCRHDLHNECLKPWVERANSCPICRQSFNKVELCSKVGGPVISSYDVADRTQVADLDPSMLEELDDDEDPEDAPCPICGDDDNEDVLMACDGCDLYYHTYCIGLADVPAGQWFCDNCQATRFVDSVAPNPQSTPASRPQNQYNRRASERRTRATQRRTRNRSQVSSSNWARVWQSVWDNLNLDLDFPFDESSDAIRMDRTSRASAERREFRLWERRLQVAERQGGANRFRDTAALLDLHAPRERPEPPEPESREEILAWNAFEKAKEIELDPTPKRKRKSTTTSPSDAEPVAEPERPLKRPRTRRILDQVEAPSSVSRRSSGTGPPSASRLSSTTQNSNSNGPSFLQSMLKEIETSSAPDETKGKTRLPYQIATNHSSPRPSSPGLSPTTSNHATPRPGSITPPPMTTTRPGSPFSLTSKVEPIFPPAEFSPNRSPPPETSVVHRAQKRQSRALQQGSSPPPSRSEDTSPTRINMPLSTKTDLQRMVSSALKPHYQSNSVNKDQYTDINRNVSRMLYDKFGGSGQVDGDAREGWERIASDEVAKAVQSLKTTTTT